MFVACDNSLPLTQAVFCRGSFIETLLCFNRFHSNCKSLNVYRDLSGKGNYSAFQYVCTIKGRELRKLVANYLSPISKNE